MQPNLIQDTVNSSVLLALNLTWGVASNQDNGELSAVTQTNNGPGYAQPLTFQQLFTYDKVSRLSTASDSGGWSRTYNYDQVGNIWQTNPSGGPASQIPQANIYNGRNQPSPDFDNAGNQTVVNGATLAYDAENRLITAIESPSSGGGTLNFTYDGAGQRVTKGNTIYVYDVFGRVAAEYSSDPQTPACATCCLSYDQIGSVRLVTNESGMVVARHDYLPFGEEVGASAGRTSEFGVGDNIGQKFTGQYHDETGLDYFNARYLSAPLGRFISPDPANIGADLMNPRSWNGYSYVGNNPLGTIDPSGMIARRPPDPWQPGGGLFDLWWDSLMNGLNGGTQQPPPPPPVIAETPASGPITNSPPKKGSCDAGVIGNFVSKYVGGNTIVSGNITTNGLTIELGALIGSLFGPEGTLPGALIGSMFGVGGSVSYVPGTGSLYAGPVATFGVGISGGSGFSVSAVHVPSSQNANSIANGKSFSLSYQPNPFLGSTVTKSPRSGPPVVGPSVGTKVPVSASAGYSFCLRHCGC